MVEQPSESMPEDLREAFHDAIRMYKDWKCGGHERSVSFRRLPRVSLSGMCDLVLSYLNEPLPVNIHDELWTLIDDMNLKVELARDPSYATGARCLNKLIKDHRAADKRSVQPWNASLRA